MLTKLRVSNSHKIKNISSISWGKCFFYALAFSVFFISSCKNPENIGLDVIPASDHLSTLYTDTVSISSISVKEDSLRSDEVSQILLGSISDVDYGVSTANLYTQVLLGQTPNLGSNQANLSADSVVLSFAYSGSYGSTSTPLTLHVYKLAEDMHLDSSYYTSRTFDSSGTDLTYNVPFTFTPHLSDSVMVGTTNEPPQLRIPLATSFAAELVALNDSSIYASNDSWKSYFKGLYIKVDAVSGSNVGSVLYFNPNSAYTKMTLYYHDSLTAKTYDFTFNNAARVNHQTHNYTGTPAGNSSYNDSLTYIQSMSGLKTHISFPYFKHIAESGKILINKAELVITVTDTVPYGPPSSLFLTSLDSAGGLLYVADYLDPLITFGGLYNASTKTYKFNIGRHLQRILDGNINDYGFSLNIVNSVVIANRVTIGSGKGTANPAKMKLNLFYTRL